MPHYHLGKEKNKDSNKDKIRSILFFLLLVGLLSLTFGFIYSQVYAYPWLDMWEQSDAILNRIPTPAGYERVATARNTFEDWLRYIPLKERKASVKLYNGREKSNQNAHFAVLDVDVGDKDLQQCADAIIRLRSEYLYFRGNYDDIHFNFTSGHKAEFSQWLKGYRPIVVGNHVKWVKIGKADSSYRSFRAYLNTVFRYAGSFSLSKEMKPVRSPEFMKIGDVFIQGGFPGHAVMVVDMAFNRKMGKKIFLLAQSYMPAQEIHILKNPNSSKFNPWYEVEFGQWLDTPEWTFSKENLMRF